MIRYLILAGGIGYRWHDHLGIPKHLIRLDGEHLIHRTVRQLRERGIHPVIVGPNDDRYRIKGSMLWTPEAFVITDTQVDKFLSSQPMWNTDGPTTWMWGDVWWSDEAMNTLTTYDGSESWHVWYRPGPSSINGAMHGEMFAHYFAASEHAAEHAACMRVVTLHKRHILPWQNTGGWGHYRTMLGLPDDQVHGWTTPDHSHVTIIDDWTDDFDTPGDYVTWYGHRARGRYRVNVVFADTVPQRIRNRWPCLDSKVEDATITVNGNLLIGEDQLWASVAHAVEHDVTVIPYTHPTSTPRDEWEAEPMWTAHEFDDRIVVAPRIRSAGVSSVRLYGHCWEVPNV